MCLKTKKWKYYSGETDMMNDIFFWYWTLVLSNRYIATLHPFSSFHRWLCSHTRPLLLSTWLIGALYASTILPHTKTVPFKFDNTTYYECSYNVDFGGTKRRLFMAANFLLTFLVPMLVLLFSYSAIMRKLREDNCSSTGKNGDQSANGKNILRKSTPANHRSKVRVDKHKFISNSTSLSFSLY